MKKIATLAVAALLATSGTFALAQGTAPAAPGTGQESTDRERPRMTQDEFNRYVDARIAGIKAGLKLTPDQEKLWQPVENAIRSNSSERFARFEERRERRAERQSLDFMQRLEQRGSRMTGNAQRTSAIATALRPLWDTLSEEQKQVAPRLLRPAVGPMGWREARGGRKGHHGMHQSRRHHQGGDRQAAPQNPQ
jgi:hypothetical protein